MRSAPALAISLVLAAATAHADRRAPLTNGVFFRPGDPHALYIRTTFGLLISHDDGCRVSWVCAADLGYDGVWDPKYAIASDGTIFATTFSGLRISRDGGCSFTTAGSLPPDTWIDAIDLGPTGEVWIGTASSGAPNDVYASTDNGATFASRGLHSPTIWWKSVVVAPSDARRVYVSGYQVAGPLPGGGQMAPTAHVLRSDDDGAHWTEVPLAGVRYSSTPIVLVAAVDPRHPEVVYLISRGANPPGGDRLYRSGDAGATWREVLATADPISNVVVHDATTVLASTQLGGSFVSKDGGTAFAPLPHAPQLACLGQRADGTLLGCAANWAPDQMALATSHDGGATWQKLWQFGELAGPVGCAAGTPEHDVCALQQWPRLKAELGVTGPTCDPAGSDVAVPATGAPAAAARPKKSGCCDAGGSPVGLAWAGAVAAVLVRRRRARHTASRQLG